MFDFSSHDRSNLQKLASRLLIGFLVLFVFVGVLGINFITTLVDGVEGTFKATWNQTIQPILVNLMSSAVGVLAAAWLFSFRSSRPEEDDKVAAKIKTLSDELSKLHSLVERALEERFTKADVELFVNALQQNNEAHGSNLKAVSKNFTAALAARPNNISSRGKNSKNKTTT